MSWVGCTLPDMTEYYTRIPFNPPLYHQRYERVCNALEKIIYESGAEEPSPKTVLDVGTGHINFHRVLRHVTYSVKKLIYVDIDEENLQRMARSTLRPWSTELLFRRETNLTAEVYAGCITKFDSSILNEGPPVYCITGIEVIEHLDPEILVGFEKTVFGLIHPPVVILTTPNAEYNAVFGYEPGEFRHEDHRFEWTRAEFEEWCTQICAQYPGYTFSLEGIGEARFGKHDPSLGHASQMVVFRRSANDVEQNPGDLSTKAFSDSCAPGSYKLVFRHTYESNHDTLVTTEERIILTVETFIALKDLKDSQFGFHKTINKKKGKPGINIIDIPLKTIISSVPNRFPLPKGVNSFEEFEKGVRAGGFNMVKCGPDQEVGI